MRKMSVVLVKNKIQERIRAEKTQGKNECKVCEKRTTEAAKR